MGILDEISASFGTTGTEASTAARQNWHGLCVCGHLDRYHSPSTGGTYALPETATVTLGVMTVTRSFTFHGCVGAVRRRSALSENVATDREKGTQVFTTIPTCPCTDMRQIVSVDRPNRYFSQAMPADPTDQVRHPFVTGVRAFSTHISRRKAATVDPHWADQEWERRFRWDDTVRICSIGHCRVSGTDVWPTFVNGDLLSELRCGAHRRP